MEPATLAAVGSLFGGLGGLFSATRSQPQQQQAPAPDAPPASQAAKTPTAATFERQNATAEGPTSGSPGSTLLTAGADLGPGSLGKVKTLGGAA